jgi:hypothetical protein
MLDSSPDKVICPSGRLLKRLYTISRTTPTPTYVKMAHFYVLWGKKMRGR